MSKYIIIDKAGNIIDWRFGGLPALRAKLARLNKVSPGHRLITSYGQ